jgi:hypothetical protein
MEPGKKEQDYIIKSLVRFTTPRVPNTNYKTVLASFA